MFTMKAVHSAHTCTQLHSPCMLSWLQLLQPTWCVYHCAVFFNAYMYPLCMCYIQCNTNTYTIQHTNTYTIHNTPTRTPYNTPTCTPYTTHQHIHHTQHTNMYTIHNTLTPTCNTTHRGGSAPSYVYRHIGELYHADDHEL